MDNLVEIISKPIDNTKAKIIALDYDDTLSVNPTMWLSIISIFKEFGYQLYIVTYRYDDMSYNNFDMQWAIDACDHVVFTGGKAKRDFCEKLDIYPVIWIDDTPEAIVLNGCHDWRLKRFVAAVNSGNWTQLDKL